ncbi:MAG TPA: helix-turn-helix transcriptional regulator [Roseiflexaceae bacterium]|nr:helix-turn-helix transcriptional regulator [Roseiflexaceae bacterium]
MEAAASYLRTIREARRLSRARVAAIMDVSEMSIWRIEEDRQEPRAERLASFVSAIQGDIRDVYELLVDRHATPDDGRHRAEELLRREGIAPRTPLQVVATNGTAPPTPAAPRTDSDILAELQEELRRSPALRRLLRGLIDAWRDAQGRS